MPVQQRGGVGGEPGVGMRERRAAARRPSARVPVAGSASLAVAATGCRRRAGRVDGEHRPVGVEPEQQRLGGVEARERDERDRGSSAAVTWMPSSPASTARASGVGRLRGQPAPSPRRSATRSSPAGERDPVDHSLQR